MKRFNNSRGFASFDSYRQDWFNAAESKGHVLRTNKIVNTIFVTDYEFHNGPGYEKCGKTWCMHCTDSDEISECKP